MKICKLYWQDVSENVRMALLSIPNQGLSYHHYEEGALGEGASILSVYMKTTNQLKWFQIN